MESPKNFFTRMGPRAAPSPLAEYMAPIAIEMAEAEYVIRANGYVSSIEDLAQIPLHTDEGGTPVLLRDVAEIRLGPDLRRGVSELGALLLQTPSGLTQGLAGDARTRRREQHA